ncbi:amino acid kinase domain protein [Metarhizium robertsii]|uniref:Isopentenyl phosphate kinase n=2 Tax=Metarhizium robertsii TaxID=568076 RepID=E9FA49_METRA|nr:kinase [Metarhizium robertsii ARSEF 23]EFY95334.1 kinase [Metarhizium robertsii ARSEF 23]EXU97359.1 amino acid kinase domain protein [Metarhizium robertsii]
METVVVKLGGAAITVKSLADTLSPNIHGLVDKVAQVYQDKLRPLGRHLILIHGAGSFGHPPAKKYNVKAGWLSPTGATQDKLDGHTRQEEERRDEVKFGMALTRQRVLQLHHHILQLLQDRGRLPVLSVSTYDTVETDQGVLTQEGSRRLITRVTNLLTQGFIPVLFGDAVLDHTWGATILSGDALMHELATHLPGVRRCVFVTDVPGIFTQDPKQYADAVLIRQLHFSESGDSATYDDDAASGVDDVTGAMRTKWQWAKRIMTDAHQVNRVIICQASVSDKAIGLVDEHDGNGLDGGDGSDAWTTVRR